MRLLAGLACLALGLGCKHEHASPKLVQPGRVGEPFGPIAALTVGMSIDEAKAHATLALIGDGSGDEVMMSAAPADEAPYASTTVTFWRGHVREMMIQVSQPLSDLVAVWGPGVPTIKVTGRDRNFYFDAKRTMRSEASGVAGDSFVVRFYRMTPLATVFGDGPTLTFLGVPLLGSPVADLDMAFAKLGARIGTDGAAHVAQDFAVTEWGRSPYVMLTPGVDGKVTKASIHWSIETAPARDATLALLAAKFGKPIARDDGSIYSVEGLEGRFEIHAELASLTVGQ